MGAACQPLRPFLRLLPVLAALLPAVRPALADGPVVRTDAGLVRGHEQDGLSWFRAIPFAAPPTGALRWRVAQPAPAWDGIRDAARDGPACPQAVRPGRAAPEQSEDCLTLTVATPRLQPGARLPVMVWIHGGAFAYGSARDQMGQQAGGGLARRGVVLVALQYRLGRFGFFAHPALAAAHPGEPVANYWLSDQIAGLGWVRRNITAFGGDPDNVTLFGVSAGGSSVNTLMAAPAARGLFAKAIVHSGGGLFNQARPLAASEAQGLEIARRHGVTGRDAAALARLRAVAPDRILAAEDAAPDYVPILDGRLLQRDAASAFAAGEAAPVPFIAGSTSDEANIFDIMGMTPQAFEQRFAVRLADARPAYEAAQDVGGPLSEADLARQVQSDLLMASGPAGLATLAGRHGVAAWVFRFAYVAGSERGRVRGVPHGGDVPYLFDQPPVASERDRRIAGILQDYWVNFARGGDPNSPGLPAWPAFRQPDPVTLVIDDPVVPAAGFRAAQLQLWLDRWSRQTGLALR